MKLKKKSGLMGAVIALSAASLVSVGFASWVISAGAQTDITGSVQVDTVSDNRLSVSASIVSGNPIVYGGLSTVDEAALAANAEAPLYNRPIWLTNNHEKTESLDLVVELTFSVPETGTLKTNLSDYVITYTLISGVNTGNDFVENETANTKWLAAEKDGLYVKPLAQVAAAPDYNDIDALDNQGKIQVAFHFGWGSNFGNVNPYQYYNSQDYSQSLGDTANTKLTDLNGYLSDVTFKLNIDVKYAE